MDIMAKYVKMKNVQLHRKQYFDKSLCLVAYDDEYDQQKLSLNISEYGYKTRGNEIFVPAYSEFEGLPEALEVAGIAVKVKKVEFGPFGAEAYLMELNKNV
jgi:hypothetical protein